MIGLKIAAVSLVLFITGCAVWEVIREGKPGEKMPSALGWMGLCGLFGIPLGLILAIIGV